jgi:hypothetical protein
VEGKFALTFDARNMLTCYRERARGRVLHSIWTWKRQSKGMTRLNLKRIKMVHTNVISPTGAELYSSLDFVVWDDVSEFDESDGEEAPQFRVGASTGASAAEEAQRLANAVVLRAWRDNAFGDRSPIIEN